jgi:hypothetical protein
MLLPWLAFHERYGGGAKPPFSQSADLYKVMK